MLAVLPRDPLGPTSVDAMAFLWRRSREGQYVPAEMHLLVDRNGPGSLISGRDSEKCLSVHDVMATRALCNPPASLWPAWWLLFCFFGAAPGKDGVYWQMCIFS